MNSNKKPRNWWPLFTGAVFSCGVGMGLISFVERTHARPYIKNVVREETQGMQTDIREIKTMLRLHCGDSIVIKARQELSLWESSNKGK